MVVAPRIIAVDGPAAAGKGTLARKLAAHFGFAFLDTGLLYRSVGLKTVLAGEGPENADAAIKAAGGLTIADLDDPRLRGEEAADAASRVAVLPAVRSVLLEFQRAFARNPPGGAGGAVLDGRDIGTRVCPDADAKFFVTANVEVRAQRRLGELRTRGLEAIHGRVLQDMNERDARDRGRDVAPLKPADDALVIDTGDKDAEAVFAEALAFITSRNRSG